MKVGQKFNYDGEDWIVTSNDGFILSADNLDENAIRCSLMWVGIVDKEMEKVTLI